MEDHLLKTIEQAKRKLSEQEQAVVDTKKLINQILSFAGQPPLYKDDTLKSSNGGLAAIQGDTFYGKSVTTAIREYLQMRYASGQGAATLNEILDALKIGGFDFSNISVDQAIANRGIAITLGKNSSIFHKLPNGNWGLLSWYPDAKEKKQQRKNDENKTPLESKEEINVEKEEPVIS